VSDIAAGPTASFGFNLAKVPDHGEDSDPILREGPDIGLAAVFDGMGGAGGTVYDTPDGARSGAYLASRLVRDVVEEYFLRTLTPDRPLPLGATAQELHDAIETVLQKALTGLNAPVSRLRSRLLRALPTTMALGALQRSEPDGSRWVCEVVWAGDSRVYALDASGLHQLSVDDLRDPSDAMANLQRDSVISNAVSADTEFVVRHRRVTLEAPFALLCATDGCFGYVPSPMHFEELVLDALADAQSDEGWSLAVQRAISAVTGDDASMATIVVGADLAAFQALTAPRRAEITDQVVAPLDQLADAVRGAQQDLADLQTQYVAAQAEQWDRYRQGYEQLLQDDPDAAVGPTDETSSRQIWNPAKRIATGSVAALPATDDEVELDRAEPHDGAPAPDGEVA
jgi:serine/threonine protein phosphatase PrpC